MLSGGLFTVAEFPIPGALSSRPWNIIPEHQSEIRQRFVDGMATNCSNTLNFIKASLGARSEPSTLHKSQQRVQGRFEYG